MKPQDCLDDFEVNGEINGELDLDQYALHMCAVKTQL